MVFATTLKRLRTKAGKSRYRLAQYSGLDQAYVLRLESGERTNPQSRRGLDARPGLGGEYRMECC